MKTKKCINFKILLMVTLVSILCSFMTTSAWAQFRFVAYGDSRTYDSDHDDICSRISLENPELIISSGDLWDGYSSSTWKSHFTSRPNLNTLLNSNKILVARGNHESSSEVLDFSPDIVRENSTTYSFLAGNVFFVCLGMDPSASYLESQLQTTEAQNADFRVIYHHYPVYSSGSHGANGDSDVEAICDKYNVTMSFAGHDHDYERSEVIYDQSVVYSGNDVPSDVEGTTYIVTGGGGAPLYSVGSEWWTDYSESTRHFCVLDAYSDRLEMKVVDSNGSVIETFIRRKGDPVPQVSLTANVVGQGTISPPTGDYDEGSTLSMTATPAPGWGFDSWSGDLTGSANPQNLLMDNNKSVNATFIQVGGTVGITDIGPKNTTSENRRAMPFIMPADGVIESVTQYHTGGSGNMYLAIYEGTSSSPENMIAVTPSTSVSSSTGWQTINLTSSVFVANGTQLWIAWVYENNPGIAYDDGTPGRVDAGVSWSGGMPESWGSTADEADYIYSIYATYSIDFDIPPVAEFSANSTNIESGQSVEFTDQSTGSPISWSWTFDGGSPDTSTSQNLTVTYDTAGIYSVTLTATNSVGSDTITKNNYIIVDDPNNAYCTSSGNQQDYEWIAGVQVGSIDNASDSTGYSDFTDKSTNMIKGESVNISLTPGFANSSYNEFWKIWIDLNNDGDFEDTDEEVYSGSGNSTINDSFTVPTLEFNGSTRMRVSMKYNDYTSYCGTFTYGEVEDYTVKISEFSGPVVLKEDTNGD